MRKISWQTVARAILLICGMLGIYQVIAWQVSFQDEQGDFPLNMKWTYDTEEPVVAVSISTNGVAAIRTSKSTLGLDTATGNLLWKSPIESYFRPAPAMFDSGKVFISNKNELWVLDEQTGKGIWHTAIENRSSSDARVVAVSQYCVLVNTISQNLSAYSRLNGNSKWKVTSGRAFASAYTQDQIVYMAHNGIQAFDELTGQTLWKKGKEPIGGSDYKDGVLYYDDYPFTIVALDVKRQSVLWSKDLPDSGRSELVIADGYVVVVSFRNLYILDADNGRLVWQTRAKGDNVVVIDEVVYLADAFTQSVTAFQIKTGQKLGSVEFGFPLLIVADHPHDTIDGQNGLLVVGYGNKVYAYSK
jgi:outer membrane protein assembly factor BamB